MKKIVLLLICVLLSALATYGQYNTPQNKFWAFGGGAGVDFSSGTPVGVSTNISTSEGCASVSDASGSLLFYTDGVQVFDRTGTVMTSGSAIATFVTGSTTQGALIVPVIGTTNKYYVFSLEEYGGGSGSGYSHLVYCIVDMSLSGGMGDVITSTIGTPINSHLSEKMIAVQGNNCNIWLVTHLSDSAEFLAYNITGSGIASTPVISHVGALSGTDCYSVGVMKISPDRSKLVAQVYPVPPGYLKGTELYDFDASTGIVTNCRTLSTTDDSYGAEFSPDNSKLYCQSWAGPITQYDISLSTVAAIIGSAYTVVASGTTSDLKLGPDSKIYFIGSGGSGTLGAVTLPNLSGASCALIASAVTLASGSFIYDGLPNLFVGVGGLDTITKTRDTSVCSSVGSITLTATSGYSSYGWSTGASGPTATVSASGNYIAFCTTGCNLLIDSIVTTFVPHTITTTVFDTAFCYPGTFTLNATLGYDSYTWQNGSTGYTYTDTIGGTFYVDGASYCADHIDSFHVKPKSLAISLGSDTTVCMNYLIKVPLKDTDVTYRWQDGSTGSTYSASHTGQYSVTVHQNGCDAKDTVNVNFFHFAQNLRDTFICKGTPIDISLQCNVPTGGHVMWNDGITNPFRQIRDSGTWWVFVSKDECEILDTIRVTTGYCKCWYNVPEAFTPNNDGLNDVFTPRIEPGCTISGYQFSIYNRWGELIFTSEFRDKGWDGMFNGVPVDVDTYMYSLQFFIGEKETPVVKNGSVIVIR